jgi:PPM family protein phosphatase
MRFSIQQNTIQGKRHENQDRMGHIYTKDALLLVVCDGLGGHGNGEQAASWALETLAQRFQHFAKPKIYDPVVFLEASIIAAHKRILKKTPLANLSTHPRTTIVCALVQEGQVWIAHAGDSRAYHVRAGSAIARTRDHSKLQFLIDTGRIKASKAGPDHPDRNRLINCLGAEIDPSVEHTGPFNLIEHDTLLLCSDGVWGSLSELQLLSTISQPSLSQALPLLVSNAANAGGNYADDATALAMRWLNDFSSTNIVNSEELDNEFESTVHLTLTQASDMRIMSDAEMDQHIDDIRNALAKVKALKTSAHSEPKAATTAPATSVD